MGRHEKPQRGPKKSKAAWSGVQSMCIEMANTFRPLPREAPTKHLPTTSFQGKLDAGSFSRCIYTTPMPHGELSTYQEDA